MPSEDPLADERSLFDFFEKKPDCRVLRMRSRCGKGTGQLPLLEWARTRLTLRILFPTSSLSESEMSMKSSVVAETT